MSSELSCCLCAPIIYNMLSATLWDWLRNFAQRLRVSGCVGTFLLLISWRYYCFRTFSIIFSLASCACSLGFTTQPQAAGGRVASGREREQRRWPGEFSYILTRFPYISSGMLAPFSRFIRYPCCEVVPSCITTGPC